MKLPSTVARAKSARPIVATVRPVTRGGLIPKRITSFAETPIESPPMIRLAGRNARPTWSGV